jgi:beta-N-acetylhexosaminidase
MGNYTDGMTLEEQLGQVLMVGFLGSTPSQEIIDLIQRLHVGNILLFSRNVRDAQQVFELTQSLQAIAKDAGQPYPLLIAIDQENGTVQRLGEIVTIFPGNMALGAIGSEEIAYNIALATGCELKALGINMNLAPVVDVNNNPANPVIGVRSFGENPQQVARLGAAMVKGYRAAGVLSCLKHFPGHGDTEVDSHLALPTIPYTLERLEALELVPFRRGIEAGAQSVMVAHISFPALTRQAMLPATLSPAIIQGLLREQLGFNGVILSDCMEMKAISETFGTERAAVMALQAGIDLLLVSHHYMRQRGSIEAIQVAVQTHELSSQAVQQAAERVLRLKAHHLSWNKLPGSEARAEAVECRDPAWGAGNIEHVSPSLPCPVPAPTACIGCEAHVQLQNQAYELSITLVRNDDTLLPLNPDSGQRIVVLSPRRNTMTMVEDRYHSDDVLAEIIERYHTPVKLLPIAAGTVENACGELLQATSESDIFVVATVNAHLDEGQAELMRHLVSSGRRVVGLAVRNPYDLLAFPQLRTYLITYECTRPALVAAVRVLFGERQALGHLPVSLHPQVLPRDD